jgi:hypothetical protein
MEHAPLRPVPARPAGPIDSATALREVASWLPTLSPDPARALALVVLAERPRGEAAASLGVSEQELGELLAEARKELRQTIAVLGGSGWCERAEGLISDRLDGALSDRDVRRLDVHLRNCPRCVEHERRLVQATDALVLGAGGRAPSPATEPTAVTPLVEAEPTDDGTEEAAPPAGDAPPADGGIEEAAPPAGDAPPADDGIEEAPPAGDAPPADDGTEAAASGAPAAPAAASAPADAGTESEPADASAATDAGTEGWPADASAPDAPAEGAPAAPPVAVPPPEDQVAAAAEVLVAVRTRRQIAGAIVWNSLIALAILLALATIGLTIAGILGAEL